MRKTAAFPPPLSCDEIGVWRWLENFAAAVRDRDYAAGLALFAEDCQGFGTVAAHTGSRAQLHRRQWSRVWPRTSGFLFRRRRARLLFSAAGDLVVVTVHWAAWNNPAPGPRPGARDRSGRATLVLRREGENWLALHSHFSFDPSSRSEPASTPYRKTRA